MILGYLLCYSLPPSFWEQLKIWKLEEFSPVQPCKHRSRFKPEKMSFVCLRTKHNQSRTIGSLGPYGISKIQISHSIAHRLSPSFGTTTVNAEHLFVDQFSYSESRIYPFRNNFNKTEIIFFSFLADSASFP